MPRSLCGGIAAGIAALALSPLLGGCGGSSDVARVGSGAISHSTLTRWQAIAARLGPSRPAPDSLAVPSGDPTGALAPRQWALSYLLAQRRIAAEAAERGIEVDRAEATRALEDFHYEHVFSGSTATVQEARLKALLASSVESKADRVQIMKSQILAARLEGALYSEALKALPESLVGAYYAAHRKSFITPEKRNVYVIQSFTKHNAELARREIEAGQTIGRVVERRNEEPDAGGAKRGLTRAELTHPYEQNYFKAPLHKLVGPLKAQIYYLFYVSNIQPRRLWPQNEVEFQIRQSLIAGPQHRVLASAVRRIDRKWRERTRCAAGYMAEQCGAQL